MKYKYLDKTSVKFIPYIHFHELEIIFFQNICRKSKQKCLVYGITSETDDISESGLTIGSVLPIKITQNDIKKGSA